MIGSVRSFASIIILVPQDVLTMFYLRCTIGIVREHVWMCVCVCVCVCSYGCVYSPCDPESIPPVQGAGAHQAAQRGLADPQKICLESPPQRVLSVAPGQGISTARVPHHVHQPRKIADGDQAVQVGRPAVPARVKGVPRMSQRASRLAKPDVGPGKGCTGLDGWVLSVLPQ